MIYRRFKHEGILYILAFLAAVALRFIQLGALPLTDAEAAPALQALRISQAQDPTLSPHPLYILFTSALFFLNGEGTNFLARFIPALMGSLLVLVPLLFSDSRIKPRSSLFLAFFIALDPGLVSLSRQAASPILAIAFLLFAWGFFEKKRFNLASVCAALALLSGPSIWLGLLGLGISWALMQGINHRRASDEPSVFSSFTFTPSSFIPVLATFLIAGTLFFIVPNGISAAIASIPAFFKSWTFTSDVPAGRLIFSLFMYQPLGVILAITAIIRGWWHGSRRIISASVWFMVALLLAIFLPSRQMGDLVWALIPLWLLASIEIVRSVDIFEDERIEILGVVILTSFLWAFTWLDLSGIVWNPVGTEQYALRFWLLIGAILLYIFSLLLVAAGWSIRIARIGGVWGLTIVLGIFSLGGAIGSTGLREPPSPELWTPPLLPMQADLLEQTARDMSEWGVGNDYSAPIVIAGLDSPALEWALRRHPVKVVDALDPSSSPEFVITPFEDNPVLVSAYRGQDFIWRQTFSWNSMLSSDWLRWIALREIPLSGENIILWARSDLFIDVPPQTVP